MTYVFEIVVVAAVFFGLVGLIRVFSHRPGRTAPVGYQRSPGNAEPRVSEGGKLVYNAAVDVAKLLDERLASVGAFATLGAPYRSPTYTTEMMIFATAPFDYLLAGGITTHAPAAAARLGAAIRGALIRGLVDKEGVVIASLELVASIEARFEQYARLFESGNQLAVGAHAAQALGLEKQALTEMALAESFLATVENYRSVLNAIPDTH